MHVEIIYGEQYDKVRRDCYHYLYKKYLREELGNEGTLCSRQFRGASEERLQYRGPDSAMQTESNDR